MKKKIILAIDSFKNCLTSVDVEKAVEEGLKKTGIEAEIVSVPVSDGGDGMLDAFVEAMHGSIISADVHDPLMRPITANYGIASDVAIIEMAKASGLQLVEVEQRNPMNTSTYGTGELIADAINKGYKKFIIGLGGSATSDTGIGMFRALLDKFALKGEHIDDILGRELKDCKFILASDVKNPLLGDNGAARIFAKQKGATPLQVEMLESRAMKFADMSAKHFGYDYRNTEGAGAAGGLGYAFLQYLGATVESGAELLFNEIKFDKIISQADMIITGEGHADAQTLMGKLPVRVLSHASKYGIPVHIMAGRVTDRQQLINAGFVDVINITFDDMDDKEATKKDVAIKNIIQSIGHYKKSKS